MTPTTLAETILRDVPRYSKNSYPNPTEDGYIVHCDDVLAALTAALDPALAERAGEVLERLQKADEYEPLGHDGWDAADLITALLAQNAALRAERDEWKAASTAHLDADLAEQAGEVLEGVTPGPWSTHAVDDTAIISSDGTDVGTTCDSAKAERDDAYNNNYEQMEADARFIAWCREGVPALLAANAALRAELDWWKQDDRAAWDKCEERRIAQEAAEAQIAALTARLEGLTGAAKRVLDSLDEPCRHDHHGYCQAHFIEAECSVAALRAALSATTEASQ